eukprot:TRINITY_DN3524_c0_g3_i1.p1 TRINITY_DN3524_c0_g3~~TRINITY_DN3524_c0_g3_i1.p1  ORF type:complete len:1791 (+),score=383.89 TRINITY_DN3524_c0_g3_i1:44-5416(+)
MRRRLQPPCAAMAAASVLVCPALGQASCGDCLAIDADALCYVPTGGQKCHTSMDSASCSGAGGDWCAVSVVFHSCSQGNHACGTDSFGQPSAVKSMAAIDSNNVLAACYTAAAATCKLSPWGCTEVQGSTQFDCEDSMSSTKVYDIALDKDRGKVYAACGEKITQCDIAFNSVAGISNCVTAVSGGSSGSSYRGVEVADGGGTLVYGVYNSQSTVVPQAGVFECDLSSGSPTSCAKLGQPCLDAGQMANRHYGITLYGNTLYVGCYQQPPKATVCKYEAGSLKGCRLTGGSTFTQFDAALNLGQTAFVFTNEQAAQECTLSGGFPTASPGSLPSASPTRAPSRSPSVPPTREPTRAPSANPTAAPSSTPTRSPSIPPSRGPTTAPSTAPTASPSTPPTRSPSVPPTVSPSAAPSVTPSASPSTAPTVRPSAAPTVPPTVQPTAAPSASPSAAPTAPPSQSPSATPTLPPSPAPSLTPTVAPSAPPTVSGPPPTTSPTTTCPPGQGYFDGRCRVCPPPVECVGGWETNRTDCVGCLCRFHYQGRDCGVCDRTLHGGLDCDRCQDPRAQPPRCALEDCVDRTSLPTEVTAACGSTAVPVELYPSAGGRTTTVAVELLNSSASVSFADPTPFRRSGDAWTVTGPEQMLASWLRLSVVPGAAPLSPADVLVLRINATGEHCAAVTVLIRISCPAPTPRVVGSLPSPTVVYGTTTTFPCPVQELAQMQTLKHVAISPRSHYVKYSGGRCTVTAPRGSGDPSTHAVNLTVMSTGGDLAVLPLTVTFVDAACGGALHEPVYMQMPPAHVGVRSFATVPLNDSWAAVQAALSGAPASASILEVVAAASGEHVPRVSLGPEQSEVTFAVTLNYTVGSARCSSSQPVRSFRGPETFFAVEKVRGAVGAEVTHAVGSAAISYVGQPPFCPAPVLVSSGASAGVSLSRDGAQTVLTVRVLKAGVTVEYLQFVDCRGGTAVLPVEIFGVAGTELHAAAQITYMEDTSLQLTVPRVITVDHRVTLTCGPALPSQTAVGNFSGSCPAGVTLSVDGPSMVITGHRDLVPDCSLTFTPAADHCGNVHLLWRCGAAVAPQVLVGVCVPDSAAPHNVNLTVRLGDHVYVPLSALFTAGDSCQERTAAADPRAWLQVDGTAISGRAPSTEAEACQTVQSYACNTNKGTQAVMCARAVSDLSIRATDGRLHCVEDTLCRLNRTLELAASPLTLSQTRVAVEIVTEPAAVVGLETAAAADVRRTSHGVEVAATLDALIDVLAAGSLVLAPNFRGAANLTVVPARGTTVAFTGPLRVVVRNVNDAPTCADVKQSASGPECQETELSCHLLRSAAQDVSGLFTDIDSRLDNLTFFLRDDAAGVKVRGHEMSCGHISALASFFGFAVAGSASVVARDDSGAESQPVPVKVTYELSGDETNAVAVITVLLTFAGSLLVLARPGTLAALFGCARAAARDGSRQAALSARVSRSTSRLLGFSELITLSRGCGLQWATALPHDEDLAASPFGSPAVVALHRLTAANHCMVVCPATLHGDVVTPAVSFAHREQDAPLTLTMWLEPHTGSGLCAFFTAPLNPLRLLSDCTPMSVRAGRGRFEHTGSAAELTEAAHLVRVVCPLLVGAELHFSLVAARGEQPLMHGVVPVNLSDKLRAVVGAGEGPATLHHEQELQPLLQTLSQLEGSRLEGSRLDGSRLDGSSIGRASACSSLFQQGLEPPRVEPPRRPSRPSPARAHSPHPSPLGLSIQGVELPRLERPRRPSRQSPSRPHSPHPSPLVLSPLLKSTFIRRHQGNCPLSL